MAGYNLTRADLDNSMWQNIVKVRDTLEETRRIQMALSQFSDEQLAALFDYTASEIAVIRAAFFDLSHLANVADGEATQASATNFFAQAIHLIGVK